MTFYPQPTAYECGPFALKHALALAGVFTEERRIAHLAGTTTAGTDEVQLGRAASAFGFRLPTVSMRDPDVARRTVREALRGGRPVLACVDQWSHWITLASEHGDRLVVVDSAEDGVFRVVEWEVFRARLAFRDPLRPDEAPLYDLNPLVAAGAGPRGARISPAEGGRLAGDRRAVARDWAAIATIVLPLGARARGSEDDPAVRPLAQVLAGCRGSWLDRVDGRGPSHRAAAADVLDAIVTVARSHDVHVLPRDRRDALRMTEALARAWTGRPALRPRRWRSPMG